MISRRGLFKMLGAVAASPALKPLAKLFPQTSYTTYLVGADAIFISPELARLVKLNSAHSVMRCRIREIAPQSFYSGNKIAEPFIYERKA